MNILVLEYLTGGGLLAQQAAPSLLAEGAAMLQALSRDLLMIPGVDVSVFRDEHAAAFPALHGPRVGTIGVKSAAEFRNAWLQQLKQCDAAWVIAPESEGILEGLSREVEVSGAALLGCPAQAIRLTADKQQTVDRLASSGVAVVPTRRAAEGREPDGFPAVVKPADGVGCAGCRILHGPEDWRNWVRQHDPQRYVLQPLLAGEALSLSVLFNHGQARLLSCNRQHVRRMQDRFVLDACEVNVFSEMRPQFDELAGRIAAAVPELWGYGGVDFIRDRHGPAVLEINPRLTTSYAGLHEALGVNPAQWVCDLWRHGTLPNAPPPGGRRITVDVPR